MTSPSASLRCVSVRLEKIDNNNVFILPIFYNILKIEKRTSRWRRGKSSPNGKKTRTPLAPDQSPSLYINRSSSPNPSFLTLSTAFSSSLLNYLTDRKGREEGQAIWRQRRTKTCKTTSPPPPTSLLRPPSTRLWPPKASTASLSWRGIATFSLFLGCSSRGFSFFLKDHSFLVHLLPPY